MPQPRVFIQVRVKMQKRTSRVSFITRSRLQPLELYRTPHSSSCRYSVPDLQSHQAQPPEIQMAPNPNGPICLPTKHEPHSQSQAEQPGWICACDTCRTLLLFAYESSPGCPCNYGTGAWVTLWPLALGRSTACLNHHIFTPASITWKPGGSRSGWPRRDSL